MKRYELIGEIKILWGYKIGEGCRAFAEIDWIDSGVLKCKNAKALKILRG